MPRFVLFAALPFLASAALAQGASAPAARAPAPQAHYPGVSPAGNAILTRLLQQGDPQLRQIILQVRDTTKEMQLAVQRPTLDVDQFAALMKRGDTLQAQSRTRQTERIVIALRALPAADRLPFLKAIGSTSAPAPVPAGQGR